jgi:hypothetical protein
VNSAAAEAAAEGTKAAAEGLRPPNDMGLTVESAEESGGEGGRRGKCMQAACGREGRREGRGQAWRVQRPLLRGKVPTYGDAAGHYGGEAAETRGKITTLAQDRRERPHQD